MVKPFEMRVIEYDPFLPEQVFAENGAVRAATPEEIFASADIMSIHVPATNETRHLICRESIAEMKDGVMLINTTRGSIIHTDELVDAVESGKVRAAALDVVELGVEKGKDHRAFHQDNLILTPHVAYNSREAADALHTLVGEAAAAIIRGEVSATTVNRG